MPSRNEESMVTWETLAHINRQLVALNATMKEINTLIYEHFKAEDEQRPTPKPPDINISKTVP